MAEKTDSELRQGLKLLAYEVNMLRTILSFYPRVQESFSSGDFVIGNMKIDVPKFKECVYLESFLVHARNLIDFLRYEGKGHRYPADIYASDFFGSPEDWVYLRGKMPKYLTDIKRRANTRLAHISLLRLEDTPETKGWDWAKITSAINPLMQKFYDNIPDRLKIMTGEEL